MERNNLFWDNDVLELENTSSRNFVLICQFDSNI